MRASRFEFEQRFFIIGAIFAVGFSFYNFDPVSVFVALQRWLAPGVRHGAAFDFQRALIALGAMLVFAAAMLRTWSTAYLRTEVVHDTSQHSEALVADGPFVMYATHFTWPVCRWRPGLVCSRVAPAGYFWSQRTGSLFTG